MRVVSDWQRCERCRKVLEGSSFPEGSPVCQACLSGPAPRARKAASRAVTVTRTAPAATAPSAPRTGAVGAGDLEVRERRAVRVAAAQLIELHQEEYDQLLAAARRAEGLRA